MNGDEILAGSNRHKEPLAIYSLSMRKVVNEISFEPPMASIAESGYVLCARYSKDRDRSVFFAGGAGKNDLKVFDNDTEGTGKFRELASFNDNRSAILCLDTSHDGKLVAFGTHSGAVHISKYDLNGGDEDGVARSPTQTRQTNSRRGNSSKWQPFFSRPN